MAGAAISARRCRVTYAAIVAAAGMAAIEIPAKFTSQLSAPGQVAGLPVGLPFEVPPSGTTVELDFWSMVVERALSAGPDAQQAERYRRTGVPLRSRAVTVTPLTGPIDGQPRIEIHFNPTTVTCLVTVDLTWPNGVDAAAVGRALDVLERTSTTVSIGSQPAMSSLVGDLATDVCKAVVTLLAGTSPVQMPRRRLCSVIDGEVTLSTNAQSALSTAGPLHQELHLLARGPAGALSSIPRSLVPRWSGSSFVWPSAVLTYVLDRGAVGLALDAVQRRPVHPAVGVSTARRHRELALIWAHIGASAAACALGTTTQTGYVQAVARDAANRIGRLWGPASPGEPWWGVEVRYLLDNEARAGVEAFLPQKLFDSERVPTKYP